MKKPMEIKPIQILDTEITLELTSENHDGEEVKTLFINGTEIITICPIDNHVVSVNENAIRTWNIFDVVNFYLKSNGFLALSMMNKVELISWLEDCGYF